MAHGLSRAVTRCGLAIDGCREYVESLDRSGPVVFSALPRPSGTMFPLDVFTNMLRFSLHPVGGFRLHIYLVNPVEHVEVLTYTEPVYAFIVENISARNSRIGPGHGPRQSITGNLGLQRGRYPGKALSLQRISPACQQHLRFSKVAHYELPLVVRISDVPNPG